MKELKFYKAWFEGSVGAGAYAIAAKNMKDAKRKAKLFVKKLNRKYDDNFKVRVAECDDAEKVII